MNKLADRFNDKKLRWRNFPMFMIRPLAEVAQYGEGKYSMYNYLKGGSQNQYLDCIKRHLDAYEDPTQDDLDPESRVSHLAHVCWNALVAIYMLEHFPELDDRFKIEKSIESPKEDYDFLGEFDKFLLNDEFTSQEDREVAVELAFKFIHKEGKDEINKA